MKKSNVFFVNMVLFTSMYFMFLLFAGNSLNGISQIYHIALLFICMWCSRSFLVCDLSFIFASISVNFSIMNLIFTMVISLIALILYYIHKKLNRRMKKWLLYIYNFIASLIYVYIYSINTDIFSIIITILLNEFFFIALLQFIDGVIFKNKLNNLTVDEKLGGVVLLYILSNGLSRFVVFDISILKIVGSFLILLSSYFGGSVGLVFSLCIGLGACTYQGNINQIVAYSLLGLFSIPFKQTEKYFISAAIIMAELFSGLFLNVYSFYSIFDFLPIIFAVLLFLFINNKKTEKIFALFSRKKDEFAVRNIINRSRDGLCKKMLDLSDVFNEMSNVFKRMMKGVLEPKEAKEMLLGEVMEKVCGDCPERNKCFRRLNKETMEDFNELASIGFKKGKVDILDVSSRLSSNCIKVNVIINAFNQLLNAYKQYVNNINAIDKSKYLLGEEMKGVGGLLKDLAEETRFNVSFDTTFEHKLEEDLKCVDVISEEIIVYKENSGEIKISLLVKNDKNIKKIEEVCSNLCGKQMKVFENESIDGVNNLLTLKCSNNFDIVYGISGLPKGKNKLSGDTYSVIKVGEDKILMAICDGMGSGKTANNTSELAISLIENLYKVGFKNEVILSSANRLLSLASDDVFSALDLCVLNLRTGILDFIKVGAVESLIRREKEFEVVSSSSLPLGILEEISPTILKEVVGKGDYVFLFSDGVLEAFKGLENIRDFIDEIESENPQDISNEILEKAKMLNNNFLPDDTTILVVKII